MDKKASVESLAEIRIAIDQIDQDMIKLLAERTRYVQAAAALKKDVAGVRDTNRVESVIKKVQDYADEFGADRAMIEKMYRNLINDFIQLELAEFAENPLEK